MSTLAKAKERIESEYNCAISVYGYSDHIRFTNGSAAYYIDIRLDNGKFHLEGERHGERIDTLCNDSVADLLDTLQSTV